MRISPALNASICIYSSICIHAVLLFASINSFPSLPALLSFIIAFTLGCSLESYIHAPNSMQFNGMPRSHPVGYQHTHYYLLAFIHLRPPDNHILFIWYDSSFGSQCIRHGIALLLSFKICLIPPLQTPQP
jgi:hypothetical protein